MYQFIESIALHNGQLERMTYHQNRMDRTRKEFFHNTKPIKWENILKLTSQYTTGYYKCRIVYGRNIQKIEIVPYIFKKISSLKLINASSFSYQYKSSSRELINYLYQQKEECDDILIIQNGQITDSSYANVALLKNGLWYTPNTYLLNGTRRQYLLDQNQIIETSIGVEDIPSYEKISLFNAMMDLGQNVLDCPQIFS